MVDQREEKQQFENDSRLSSTLVSWFGAVGAAFTIFSNFDSIMSFSQMVLQVTSQWQRWLAWPVETIAALFSVNVTKAFAALISFAVLTVLVGLLARSPHHYRPKRLEVASGLAFALVVSALYYHFVAAPVIIQRASDILPTSVLAIVATLFFISLTYIRSIWQIRIWALLVAIVMWMSFLAIAFTTDLYRFSNSANLSSVSGQITAIIFSPTLVMPIVAMNLASHPLRMRQRNFVITLTIAALVALNAAFVILGL